MIYFKEQVSSSQTPTHLKIKLHILMQWCRSRLWLFEKHHSRQFNFICIREPVNKKNMETTLNTFTRSQFKSQIVLGEVIFCFCCCLLAWLLLFSFAVVISSLLPMTQPVARELISKHCFNAFLVKSSSSNIDPVKKTIKCFSHPKDITQQKNKYCKLRLHI